jgi:hypothetical protein
MSNIVKRTIKGMDDYAGNFGFSQNYGLAALTEDTSLPVSVRQAAAAELGRPISTILSANPAIDKRTYGKSTFMVKITCAVTGTGSGNTENPIFLFAGNAFNNCARPYNSVLANGQTVTTGYHNGKNVLLFRYTASVGNYAEYTVTLGTKGDYPFLLNSQSGKAGLWNTGIQIEINDATFDTQLSNEMVAFSLDEFGKAITNDLTTPKDLYQYSTKGVFIPHQFKISGDDGIYFDVLEEPTLETKLYFYATKITV